MKRREPAPQKNPRHGRWSSWELFQLEKCYGTCGDAALVRKFKRPIRSIHKRAQAIFDALPRRDGASWDADSDGKLRMCLGVVTIPVMARILGRREDEVQRRVEELRLRVCDETLTKNDRALLKQLYGSRDDETLAIAIGKSTSEIARASAEMALAKDKVYLRKNGARDAGAPARSKMPRWSEEELNLLKKWYPNEENVDIAKKMKRSAKSVMSKAHDLQLKKSEAFLTKMGRRNVEVRYKKSRIIPVPPIHAEPAFAEAVLDR